MRTACPAAGVELRLLVPLQTLAAFRRCVFWPQRGLQILRDARNRGDSAQRVQLSLRGHNYNAPALLLQRPKGSAGKRHKEHSWKVVTIMRFVLKFKTGADVEFEIPEEDLQRAPETMPSVMSLSLIHI